MHKTHTPSDYPDRWSMIKVAPSTYKIFGSWIGGYIGGEAWSLNSGIESVDEDEDFYYFYGFSGSCYRCGKRDYSIATSYSSEVLEGLLEKSGAALVKEEDLEGIIGKINQNKEDE